jgi:transcriptional regulator with XRE-family HTH domain
MGTTVARRRAPREAGLRLGSAGPPYDEWVDGETRRREFAGFLRARRERLDPREIGLPTGGRRRTPGLRRQEVAQLAGLSVDYYTRLEQARDLRPSASVVDALARALRLGTAERDHLFRLARTEMPQRADRVAGVRPSVRQVLAGWEPNPALLTGRHNQVLGWNRPMAALIMDFGQLPPDRRCLAELFFLHEPVRHVWADRESAARDAAGALRGLSGRHPGDVELTAVIDRLLAASDEFRAVWGRHDVVEKTTGGKDFAHPEIGRFTLDYEALAVGGTDQTLFLYSAPAGSTGEAAIAMLNRLPARV